MTVTRGDAALEPRSSGLGAVWFRNDLRLEDNPAWNAATATHRRVAALYVVDPALQDTAGPFRLRRNFDEVRKLDQELRSQGGCLTVRAGRPEEVISAEVRRLGATTLYLNRNPGPACTRRDALVGESLPSGVDVRTFWGNLVLPPGSVQTKAGSVPRVFTSFWKRWSQTSLADWPVAGEAEILNEPGDGMSAFGDALTSDAAGSAHRQVELGTDGAHGLLAEFIADRLERYSDERDSVASDSTSALSVAMHFGTISPRMVVAAASGGGTAGEAFLRQVAWRDWYAHLMFENPRLVTESMRPEYDSIEWRDDPVGLRAWKEGLTGYPIVDAAMRQLSATGRMHNRARLIAASFLVKDLLIDWRHGERHFRYLLLDGDISQNVGNWQWVAGVGPDAAPYFRIFNPTRQAEAHDPNGDFVREWVPELRDLSDRHIHTPWLAPEDHLEAAGVDPDSVYRCPIVDHSSARDRALGAYKSAKAQQW